MTHRTIFQKCLCLLTAAVFAVSILAFSPACSLSEALPADASGESEPADLALERLNRYAEQVHKQKELSFGYPGNLDIHLTGFYEWLMESGVYSVIANNAGDPFDNHETYMNTLDFEREVIEFFAPFYGFSPDNLWESSPSAEQTETTTASISDPNIWRRRPARNLLSMFPTPRIIPICAWWTCRTSTLSLFLLMNTAV